MVVLVTGATGFLGRRVVHELLEHNYEVRCLVHSPGRERIFPPRSVDVHYGSVTDPDALASAFQGVDHVVHLVAVVRQRKGSTYSQINHQGAANVVEAAKQAGGVKHFVEISNIGAANNPRFPFLYSKWQAEQEVINSGLPYTILRPSLIFGEGDEFINALAALVKAFPLVPVVGLGRNRLQPIAAEDVGRCIALTLAREDLNGRTIEIGGPEQLSYNQIVDLVARAMGKRRLKVHLPVFLMRLNVAMMELTLPRPPITTEQVRMLQIRNVAEVGTVEETFGFTPCPLGGNIDFVNSMSFADAIKVTLGFMPSHIRDH
ncbi:MAG TPA: complex I NDUFA9 subunit family protein [Dehalococcoidia bacterium]|nr:complex I NDUFA9 subunit family protein [Dehalococcoidia bacterium]